MLFEWDEVKNQININKHGISFLEAHNVFKNGLWFFKDLRQDYGEVRYVGFGYSENRLLSVVYTERLPNKIRIISLRKANTREIKRYEQYFKNRLE